LRGQGEESYRKSETFTAAFRVYGDDKQGRRIRQKMIPVYIEIFQGFRVENRQVEELFRVNGDRSQASKDEESNRNG
jgi:Ca2+-binding EF-hand superfamily protein